MTQLCVPIFVSGAAQARAAIAAAAEAGADLVELRVDAIEEESLITQIVRESILPCIATCRPEWEGGQSKLTDQARILLLTAAVAAGAKFIDLELAAYRTSLANYRTELEHSLPLILSSHDFRGRPEKLHNLVLEMDRCLPQVNKIVWTARTIRDNLEAFELLGSRARPTIALCMGEAGIISRILAKKFGAFLTFASLSTESATAPGQVTLADLKGLYRWDAIGANTRVFGVVAKPVMHSMSPAIHNAAFDAIGYDGVYLPLLVEPSYESFKAFIESFVHFEGMDLSGLSVTIPHKENALRYLKEKNCQIEDLAVRIGAVNTIIIEREGKEIHTRGMNTDYAAILDSITAAMGITREKLAGEKVAIFGAGGTGRTAVAALAHYGAEVFVYNRTRDRAEALAAEFNGKSGQVIADGIENIASRDCRIFINTTSLGMSPKVDASPLDGIGSPFSAESVVFDSVYNPMRTKFIRLAQEAGAKTILGDEMFLRQAAAQFEAWTKMPAPRDIMQAVIRQRLSPKDQGPSKMN